jgi:lysophospholipase L1-like esterase
MSLGAKLKTFFSRRATINILTILLLAAAGLAILQVGALAWKGKHIRRVVSEKPRIVISIGNPYSRLAVAAACLLLAGLVRRWPSRTRQDWTRLGGRLILLVVSLAISVLLAEIALRVLLLKNQEANSLEEAIKRGEAPGKVRGSHPLIAIIQPCTNQTMVYELKPNLVIDFGHRTLRTNRHGMRDSLDYDWPHPSNTVRIVGVGDSGIFGWDMNQDEDYLSVLESNLTARSETVYGKTRFEALNFGIPGYNTAQEVEMLATRGISFQPDIVIIGWNVNDFDIPFCVVQKANFTRRDISFLNLLLFDRTRFREACFSGVADNRTKDMSRIPTNLIEMSGENGVRYAMKRALDLSRQHPFHILVFGAMDKRIVEICKEVGIPLYNTLEKVDASKYPQDYAVHSFHPRQGGHRVLAEHLETFMRDQDWLKPAPAPAP